MSKTRTFLVAAAIIEWTDDRTSNPTPPYGRGGVSTVRLIETYEGNKHRARNQSRHAITCAKFLSGFDVTMRQLAYGSGSVTMWRSSISDADCSRHDASHADPSAPHPHRHGHDPEAQLRRRFTPEGLITADGVAAADAPTGVLARAQRTEERTALSEARCRRAVGFDRIHDTSLRRSMGVAT